MGLTLCMYWTKNLSLISNNLLGQVPLPSPSERWGSCNREKLKKLPKVIPLVSDAAGAWTQAVWVRDHGQDAKTPSRILNSSGKSLNQRRCQGHLHAWDDGKDNPKHKFISIKSKNTLKSATAFCKKPKYWRLYGRLISEESFLWITWCFHEVLHYSSPSQRDLVSG